MKDKKWMKGLPEWLIHAILDLGPREVSFEVVQPKWTVCKIVADRKVGTGVAICSVRDKHRFSVQAGKKLSAGRALLAITSEKPSLPIRDEKGRFPRSWLPSQMRRVIQANDAFLYKSDVVGIINA